MRRWTQAETDLLRQNYIEHAAVDLARVIGRSPDAIKVHACRLGLTSGHPNGRSADCNCGMCRRFRARLEAVR